MADILVSYFEAFAEQEQNSSEEVVKTLISEGLGQDLDFIKLPVAFDSAWELLKKNIIETKPEIVIALGQAEGRALISLEQIALNVIDAKIKDNKGELLQDRTIHKDLPIALLTRLNFKKIKDELQGEYPVQLSYSAGTFVCNYLLFELLANEIKHNYASGFIHLPLFTGQVASTQACLTKDIMAQTLKLIFDQVRIQEQ